MFYPDEALQRLEEVSYLVKNQDTKNIEEFLRLHDKRLYAAPNKAVAKASSKAIDGVLKMVYKEPAAIPDANANDGEEGEEQKEAGEPIGFMPDICSDNKHLYPYAGISFGEYGTYILHKSLKALCVKTGASNLRFWGKIRGTKADYYIAEVTADAAGDGDDPD
jgi:ribosomal protein L12E/L44/L45/RPP1/RPP2